MVSQGIADNLNMVVAEAMKKEAAIHLMAANRGRNLSHTFHPGHDWGAFFLAIRAVNFPGGSRVNSIGSPLIG